MRLRRHWFRGGVTSSDGWRVWLGPRCVVYEENKKTTRNAAERFPDGRLEIGTAWQLHSSWDPPHAEVPMTRAQWECIIRNVLIAMEHLRIPVVEVGRRTDA
jgi:hypothetical protein